LSSCFKDGAAKTLPKVLRESLIRPSFWSTDGRAKGGLMKSGAIRQFQLKADADQEEARTDEEVFDAPTDYVLKGGGVLMTLLTYRCLLRFILITMNVPGL
jgi:hypothetical protein